MALILVDGTEIDVAEEAEDILNLIVNSRDGIRRGSSIVAPAGWVIVTAPGTGESIYVQVARIGCVRED
jgi:hypothetical protein